jgi:N-acetylmuramoyl-L-alanine amidase
MDLKSVHGKKIVIDPGHGGVFRGARGLGGLDEADVNLGVALYLWGLLDEAGAEVILTRKTDRDFVNGDAQKLRVDLQARVEVVVEADPDVFISLHHNAHFEGDRAFNEIQIYHKIGDDGPSLDLARIVARYLRGNIGEAKTRVLAGNYYVLRNSPVTSILCEPSFISNPDIEEKLKLADKQRLEAEVYFVALVDYFSRGIPEVQEILPSGRVQSSRPQIDVAFAPASPVDVTSVSILVDEEPLEPFKVGPNRYSALPVKPLASGRHTARASARSIGGNSSQEAISDFTVHLDPEVLTVTASPERATAPYPQKIAALVLDGNGNPVADSTEVEFSWDGGSKTRPTDRGRASVYVGTDIPFDTGSLKVTCGGLEEDLRLRTSPDAGYVSGFARSSDGSPLKGAAVTTSGAGPDQASGAAIGRRISTLSDALGYFLVEPHDGTGWLETSRQGYRKAYTQLEAGSYPTIRMERFYTSLGEGLVVTVDAEGGGDETGWVGPTGTSAADLNLVLARTIAGLLSSVGVDARLTRDADERVAGKERVAASESNSSTLLLSVSHAKTEGHAITIGHFPGSSGGISLAGKLNEELTGMAGSTAEVGEIAEYLIQQTSCPAVKVTFPVSDTVQDEIRLGETRTAWNKAYAIACAVIRYLGVAGGDTFSMSGRVLRGGEPLRDALVQIDGALELLPDSDGRFTVKLLEPGEHTAEAFTGADRSVPVSFGENSDEVLLELPSE